MRTPTERIKKQAAALPDAEKLRLVDALLSDLDKPDPAIDRLWAQEADRRWKAYKKGKLKTVSYHEVTKRLRKK